MNISTLMGISVSLAVLWFGVIGHSSNPKILLDSHALILVVGGTIGAGLLAFPVKSFKNLLNFVIYAVLYPRKKVHSKIVEQLILLSAASASHKNDLNMQNEVAHHPFLAEGYRLITRGQLNLEAFKSVLQQRSQRFKERYLADAKMLAALGKFPPAFGLLGATTGMIAMMSNLGSGGQDTIGPSMAIALVATFWGIAVANFVLLPLSDHAMKLADDDNQTRTLMMTGLVLIHQGARPPELFEHLVGFLPVNERDNPKWRAMVGEADLAFAGDEKDATVIDMHKGRAHKTGA